MYRDLSVNGWTGGDWDPHFAAYFDAGVWLAVYLLPVAFVLCAVYFFWRRNRAV